MRRIFSLILLLAPMLLFAQANEGNNSSNKTESDTVVVPILAQYSDRFKINPIYFNKRTDIRGLGEILEIEMTIENLTDEPIDLNIFTIATYETSIKSDSSFEMPVDKTDIIKVLVASPENDGENFKYALKDEDGNIQKDYFGKDRFEYRKVPRDATKGHIIKLEDTYLLRTYHLCKYTKKYSFFNEATIIIYDLNGNPVFFQSFLLDKYRR